MKKMVYKLVKEAALDENIDENANLSEVLDSMGMLMLSVYLQYRCHIVVTVEEMEKLTIIGLAQLAESRL